MTPYMAGVIPDLDGAAPKKETVVPPLYLSRVLVVSGLDPSTVRSGELPEGSPPVAVHNDICSSGRAIVGRLWVDQTSGPAVGWPTAPS